MAVTSSRARRGPASGAWLAAMVCLLGFVAVADQAFAADGAAIDDPAAITEPLLSSIADEEMQNGPFSPNLVGLLTRLGLAYQEYGEHALAVTVLDRALYLKRYNDGLYSFEQAPLLERLIDSQREIGLPGTAAELEGRLLELARRHPGDLRTVPILRDAAEREVDYYERYLRHELPAVFSFGEPDPVARMARQSVWRARGYYNQAIKTLLSNGYGHQAELAELEEDLTRTYYLEGSNRRSWYQGPDDALYSLGLVSYMRRVAYTRASEPTPFEYARALVELADWSLLFSRNGSALKRYAQAHALLANGRVPAEAIEELFPTDTPVFLPVFAPPPLGAAIAGASGYLDVDFDIGKYGDPRRIRVVGLEGRDAAELSRAVVVAIAGSRIRPSPLAELAGGTTYRLRFSLADGSLAPRR